jgi:hypothetical protein
MRYLPPLLSRCAEPMLIRKIAQDRRNAAHIPVAGIAEGLERAALPNVLLQIEEAMPRMHNRQDRRDWPSEAYLHDIRTTPVLSAAEGRDIVRRVKQGDAAARDHLVWANLRLVTTSPGALQDAGFPWRTSSLRATWVCRGLQQLATPRRDSASAPTRLVDQTRDPACSPPYFLGRAIRVLQTRFSQPLTTSVGLQE